MKNFFKVVSSCFIAGIFIMVALGCASTKDVSYNVSLNSVESPADAKIQFGETKVVSFLDSVMKYSYEDDYISITWKVEYNQFNFTLLNKSNYTIKINWDDISYVDYNGQTGRVMHAGVKYQDKNRSQPSSMIPKGAFLTDVLLPTENVYWANSTITGFSGWRENSLIPNRFDKKVNIAEAAGQYVGKKMIILMPIYIENVQNDYLFTFNIDSYELLKKK